MPIYKLVNALIKVTPMDSGSETTIGVAEGMSMELTIEGGVVHYYGSTTGEHAQGGSKATFSLRRFYKADTDTSLLYDLFSSQIPFTLTAEISGVSGSIITLSACMAYAYRPVMGGPNDIFGEEITGEAVAYTTGPTD